MNKHKPLWRPTNGFITASCHFAWGALIVLFFAPRLGIGYSFAGLALWAGVKEYAWDSLVERDSFEGNTTDFVFYLLGGLFGWILWSM